MSFVRTVKRENPFVQIDTYFLNDDRLSWAAKGVLGYILSKPNTWQIRKADLIKKSQDGKTKVETALLNLMANGYIHWYQEVREDGTFGDWIYEVYERPEFNPNLIMVVQEGQARTSKRKARIKKRNEIRDNSPKVDNQLSDSPKVDYPPSDNPTSENHPYSNNDFSHNDFSHNEFKEEEEGAANITELTSFFLKNISATGKQIIEGKLKDWLTLLPYEVVKGVLENCALHGAKSWKYVQTALKEINALGITTIEQLERKYEDHQEKRNQEKPTRGQRKPVRAEQLPEWYDEHQEEIYGTGAAEGAKRSQGQLEREKKEIDDILAEFKNNK